MAHYRSGTLDIFYVDRIDFFYDQSAPLTNEIWDHKETLSRVTRIIRTAQPDVYVGWTPTLAAGHGDHQVAGRLIWEGMKAAADPHMFPGQLRGPHPLSTWQVKKVFSGGSTQSTGTKYGAGSVAFHLPEFVDDFQKHHVQLPLDTGDAAIFNPALFQAREATAGRT